MDANDEIDTNANTPTGHISEWEPSDSTTGEIIHKDAHVSELPTVLLDPEDIYKSEDSYKSEESAQDARLEVEAIIETEERPVNTRALPEHAKTYNLEKFKQNAMIIFNHEKVEGYADRKGTLNDEKILRETFSKFGFKIHETGRNLKKVEVFSALAEFSEQNFTDYGCVVIVILTHGTNNGLLRATDRDQLYSERDIISFFKSQKKLTLITKPIILIIQACRGTASTKGVRVNTAFMSLKIPKDHEEEFKAYYLPVESDMLVFHSSYPGKPSYRPEKGSWFIQTLCKLVNKLYRTHDLESIFTEVKREVAIDKYTTEFNAMTREHDVHKQMPVVTSTLIRKLYLRRFNDTPPTLLSSLPNSETLTDAEFQNDNYCECFMDHFNYMKECLRYIIKNHPRDVTAISLLHIAESESGINDEDVKNKLIIINNHIRNHYKDTEFHKFIHFYETGSYCDDNEIGPVESTFQIVKKWNARIPWSQHNIVFMCITGVGAYLVYRYFNTYIR